MELPSTIQEIEKHNLRCYRIENDAATAEIYAHGAHIAHWQPHGERPVLWMSQHSHFEAGKPIRGGVPICFPWFGPKSDDANAPAHGLARTLDWQLDSASEKSWATELIFVPSPEITAQKGWPDCDVQVRFYIGQELRIDFLVHNRTASTCSYEIALHSYFAVSNVRKVYIDKLRDRNNSNVLYYDKVAQRDCVEKNTSLRFNGETDRVYETTRECMLWNVGWSQEIIIDKVGSYNTIVWNPWIEKAARMEDFGDDEWMKMVCIETANVGDNRVVLGPYKKHCTLLNISMRGRR